MRTAGFACLPAKSSFNKLVEKIKIVSPENLLKLTDEELRACYFSRQKALYSRILASEIISGNLNLEDINSQAAEENRFNFNQNQRNRTLDNRYVFVDEPSFFRYFSSRRFGNYKSGLQRTELVAATASKEDR